MTSTSVGSRPRRAKHVGEVGDLAPGEREAQRLIHARKRRARVAAERDMAERAPGVRLEEARGLAGVMEDRLGHRVEERRRDRGERLARHRGARIDAPRLAALDAPHGREAADVGDVRRLRRPGRDRAEPRHGEERLARRLRLTGRRRSRGVARARRARRARARARCPRSGRTRRRRRGPKARCASRPRAAFRSGSSRVRWRPGTAASSGQRFTPGSPPAGYRGTGNGATLPPSSTLILLTPCLRTSSMRITACSGR